MHENVFKIHHNFYILYEKAHANINII